MAILRAGPWGNLTDSFQAVPSDTTADELTLYPVNCAKTNWLSGQAWGAYYEVEESDGCCTPATLDFSGVSYDSTGNIALSGTLERNPDADDPCEFYTWTDGTYTVELIFQGLYYSPSPPYSYIGTSWQATMYDFGGPIGGAELGPPGDPCDPTGTYTGSGGATFSATLP